MTDEKTRLANRERQKRFRKKHKEKINAQRRERYNNRVLNKKCPRCGRDVAGETILCPGCCKYQTDLNRKYAKEKKAPEKIEENLSLPQNSQANACVSSFGTG